MPNARWIISFSFCNTGKNISDVYIIVEETGRRAID
jgi:hypothetical protein